LLTQTSIAVTTSLMQYTACRARVSLARGEPHALTLALADTAMEPCSCVRHIAQRSRRSAQLAAPGCPYPHLAHGCHYHSRQPSPSNLTTLLIAFVHIAAQRSMHSVRLTLPGCLRLRCHCWGTLHPHQSQSHCRRRSRRHCLPWASSGNRAHKLKCARLSMSFILCTRKFRATAVAAFIAIVCSACSSSSLSLLKATRVCSWSAQRRSQGSTALVRPAHIHTCTCAQTKEAQGNESAQLECANKQSGIHCSKLYRHTYTRAHAHKQKTHTPHTHTTTHHPHLRPSNTSSVAPHALARRLDSVEVGLPVTRRKRCA